MQLNKRLQELREQAGYATARQFAKAIGLPQSTYQTYESGKSEPKASVLIKIASALHISVNDLLGYAPDELNNCIHFIESATISGHVKLSVILFDDNKHVLVTQRYKPIILKVIREEGYQTDIGPRIAEFDSHQDFIDFVQTAKSGFLNSPAYKAALSLYVENALTNHRLNNKKGD